MSVLKEEYTKEEILEMAETFAQLETVVPVAWQRLIDFITAMQTQVVKAGLAAFRDPPEIAHNAGYYDGLGTLLELPVMFKTAAQGVRAAAEEEAEQKRQTELLLKRRGVQGGEVSL